MKKKKCSHLPPRWYFYGHVSPGQQANDIHLTVCWHPNPLRHLTRGIANLLAIIQFASCKLPFHSAEETPPSPPRIRFEYMCPNDYWCSITILAHNESHKSKYFVYNIACLLDGESVQYGWDSGKSVIAHCWLGQTLQGQARGASIWWKYRSESLSHAWDASNSGRLIK